MIQIEIEMEATTQMTRFHELNDGHKLNMRAHGFEQARSFFEAFEIEYTVQVVKIGKDGKKTPINLSSVGLCKDVEYAKNNAWESGDNAKVLKAYDDHPDVWRHICEVRGYTTVYAYNTTQFITFDIDKEEDLDNPFIRRLLLKYPAFLSMTKGLFKIICPRTDKMPPSLLNAGFKSVIFSGTDVLGAKNWSYVPTDAVVWNADMTADMIYASDYKDYPLTKTTKPKYRLFPALEDTTTYPKMSREEFYTMIDFILTCSEKEFPDNPDKRVFANYVGDSGEPSFLLFMSCVKAYDPEHGFEIVQDFAPRIARYNVHKNSATRKDYDNCKEMSIGCLINLHKIFLKKFPPPPSPPTIPDAYTEEPEVERIRQILEQLRDGICHQTIIAELFQLHTMIQNFKYCCSDAKWFIVNDKHYWVQMKEQYPPPLQQAISTMIQTYLDEFDNDKTTVRLRNMIGSSSFVNGVCTLLREKCRHDGFRQLLDTNASLWGFSDGYLFDVDANAFRTVEPSDYMTLQCGYEMPLEDPEVRKEIDTFYDSCFIQEKRLDKETDEEYTARLAEEHEKREYILNTAASSLFKGNIQQEFYMHTGEGQNGKGCHEVILKNCFGHYHIDFNPDILCKDSFGNNSHSDLPRGRGKRFAHFGELDSEGSILPHVFKHITGADELTARAMYEKVETFMPQFGCHMFTNDIPKMKTRDNASERRARTCVWPFLFKDQDEIDACEDEEQKFWLKLKDHGLKPRLQYEVRYGKQLWLMLKERYVEQINHKHFFKVPNDWKLEKEIYMEDSDPIITFMTKNYTINEDPSNEDMWTPLSVLLSEFKESVIGKPLKNISSKRFAINLHTAKYPFHESRKWVTLPPQMTAKDKKRKMDTIVKVIRGGSDKEMFDNRRKHDDAMETMEAMAMPSVLQSKTVPL